MNKRLLITSTELMMVQFLVPHVIYLSQKGFSIDLACSEVGGRFQEVVDKLSPYTGNIFKLSLQRSPLSRSNLKGYNELKEIFSAHRYDYVWTNEPVMGVMTRLAARQARRSGTKIIYMAHGFHFFKGAPLQNWLIYYPIEKLMAHHADMICTVNTDDYAMAETFNVKDVKYIHGIGINTSRLTIGDTPDDIRKELNLPDGAFIVLSVGELNKNKNQTTIIRALSLLKNPDIHYILCGKGAEEQHLRDFAKACGLNNNIHFLGYRKDVVDICSQANVYVMPSLREGLPVSSLEAMYCGLPLITSNIRGLTDVNKAGINGLLCKPNDYTGFADAINYLYKNPDLRHKMGKENRKDVIPYTIKHTLKEVENLFR